MQLDSNLNNYRGVTYAEVQADGSVQWDHIWTVSGYIYKAVRSEVFDPGRFGPELKWTAQLMGGLTRKRNNEVPSEVPLYYGPFPSFEAMKTAMAIIESAHE